MPKRRAASDGVASLPKRNKKDEPAPALFDEAVEIEAASTMQQSLQRGPPNFNEENEIQSANSMRLAFQQGPRHSPMPSNDVLIKQEPSDPDAPSAFSVGAGGYQSSATSRSDEAIAVDITTAADILRRYDDTHLYFRTAVDVLHNVCVAKNDMQVRSIVDQMVREGVKPDRAQEVAAILHHRISAAIPLGEVAASLQTVDQLDGVLTGLEDRSPSEEVRAQLRLWRKDIRSRRIFSVDKDTGPELIPGVATTQDVGGLMSRESQDRGAYMSGALQESPDEATARVQREVQHNVPIKEEQMSDAQGEGGLISLGADPNRQESVGETVKDRFPTKRIMFLFHVFEACKSAGILLDRRDCDKRAGRIWRRCRGKYKRKWNRLHKALLAGDATALEPLSAQALLSERHLPAAMMPIPRSEALSDASAGSDSEDHDPGSGPLVDYGSGMEEAESNSDDNDGGANDSVSGFPLRDFSFKPLRGSDGPFKVNQLTVGFKRHQDDSSRLVFAVCTPEHPVPVSEFTVMEWQRTFTTQLSSIYRDVIGPLKKHTYSVEVHSPEVARTALVNNTSVVLRDHRVYAERPPDKDPQMFLCDFMDQKVPEQELSLGVRRLFCNNPATEDIELLRYPGSQYLVRFSKPMQYLRLYVRIRWNKTEICIARFRSVDTTTIRKCPICNQEHAWPCDEAPRVPMPKLGK